jgi:hypothetical protein
VCIIIKRMRAHAQLATLVAQGHVAQTSASVNMDEPKYRCLLELDDVRVLAK